MRDAEGTTSTRIHGCPSTSLFICTPTFPNSGPSHLSGSRLQKVEGVVRKKRLVWSSFVPAHPRPPIHTLTHTLNHAPLHTLTHTPVHTPTPTRASSTPVPAPAQGRCLMRWKTTRKMRLHQTPRPPLRSLTHPFFIYLHPSNPLLHRCRACPLQTQPRPRTWG
jgi:hypothetical protein